MWQPSEHERARVDLDAAVWVHPDCQGSDVVEIHISDILTFRSCRQKWDFSSHLRQNLERRQPPRALELGIGIHAALQFFHEPAHRSLSLPMRRDQTLTRFERWMRTEFGRIYDTPGFKSTPELEKEFSDSFDLGLDILRHYLTWAPEALRKIEWLRQEVPFRVPLPDLGTVTLAGRFDGLARKDGKLWLTEFKTTSDMRNMQQSLFGADQTDAYLYAAEMLLDQPIAGVIYIFLRKKAPAEPRVLKGGGLSQDKSQDTTLELYQQAIRKMGLKEVDYMPMLVHLQEKGNTFFQVLEVARSPRAVKNFVHELQIQAAEMLDYPHIYRSRSQFNCPYCPFADPCQALNDVGADIRLMLKASYTKRTSHADSLTQQIFAPVQTVLEEV